jgi:alkanesulfonate monooxygenase SsuD/methylene tetrahydromethanopterin reductase-like flavin-dependent oxidoreductase (luciferase family)
MLDYVKFTLQYPLNHGYDARLLDPATMTRFVTTAERAGFDAVAFTEHPAPSQKWLATGGTRAWIHSRY